MKAEASWDSAVHSCLQLSKGTPADERVFLILRVTVQLSHPADMQLVLRKRICVHVHGRQVRLTVPFTREFFPDMVCGTLSLPFPGACHCPLPCCQSENTRGVLTGQRGSHKGAPPWGAQWLCSFVLF